MSCLPSILSIRIELANVIDFRGNDIDGMGDVLTRNALEYRI